MARQAPTARRLILSLLALFVLVPAPFNAHGARAEAPRPAVADGSSADREVAVLNSSPLAINELYVSPQSADQWGEDRLGEHTVAAGASVRVRLGRTRECVFDVKVIYEDASREENRGVNLCRLHQLAFDGSTATAPPETGTERSATLLNRSPQPIQQVFISPADAPQWGDDRLAESSISVGDRRDVTWRGTCGVDLRVVFANRAAEERRGVDLCATPLVSIEPGWTTADALPVPRPGPATPEAGGAVVIANHSGQAVTEFYLTPEGETGPARDLLGAAVLPDGAEQRLPFDRGTPCRFAARIVFAGRTADAALAGLDLCASPRIELLPP